MSLKLLDRKDGPFTEKIGNTDVVRCQMRSTKGNTSLLDGLSGKVKDGVIVALSCPAQAGNKCTKTDTVCPGQIIPKF